MRVILTKSPRLRVAAALILTTLALTAAMTLTKSWENAEETAEVHAYQTHEVQEVIAGLHRDLAMISMLTAFSGNARSEPVMAYLTARRNELSAIRWLAYVPAPEDKPTMLLGSAVMSSFDHRRDPAVFALLKQTSAAGLVAGIPATYRGTASLMLALPGPHTTANARQPALVALIDVDDLLRDSLRDLAHVSPHFEMKIGDETIGHWPPSNHHENKATPHTTRVSAGLAEFTLIFANTPWPLLSCLFSPLPLTVLCGGIALVMTWLLATRSRPQSAGMAAPAGTAFVVPALQDVRRGQLWQLGELLASLSHEMGQPLNVIRLTAEAALDAMDRERAEPDRIRRSLNAAVGQSIRLQSMIDALLACTRRSTAAPGPLAPVEVIRQALAKILPRLQAQSIHLTWHPDLATPCVTGHADRLERAVLNVLTNACDALSTVGPDGPAVDGRRTLSVSCRNDAQAVVITIADNGPGFPPALRASLDQPFHTVPKAGKGCGIGLAVTLGIVAEMEGSLAIYDGSPGAIVTIRLPMNHPPAERTVLVVDDEPEAAREIADFLSSHGWETQVAQDGAEALRLFDQTPFQAVVTDLRMPNGDGWSLIATLSARAPDLPIIAVSAAHGEEARRAVLAGAVVVLNKPVGLDEILQELENVTKNEN